jgi:dihydropteroate synthase
MGVLNVTPDSFSDGGLHLGAEDAIAAAVRMAEDGADIIDIGGESSRPRRAAAVTAAEECDRVLPVVRGVRERLPHIPISVDTHKAEVARIVLDAGADIINDISALGKSPEIAALAAHHGAGLLLMHMQGDPETMQDSPRYDNVLVDIKNFLLSRVELALSHGVSAECIAVDPGIGFGKTVEHNLEILSGLEYLRLLQLPVCVGVSRKSFLGALTGGLPADEREEATIAACCAAVMNGASIVRVHNVRAVRRATAVIDAIRALS